MKQRTLAMAADRVSGFERYRVTVLALWGGTDTGRDGGTAQMVRLARDMGSIDFSRIDSRELLG